MLSFGVMTGVVAVGVLGLFFEEPLRDRGGGRAGTESVRAVVVGFPMNRDRSQTKRAITEKTHSLIGSPAAMDEWFCRPQAHEVNVPPNV